MQFLKNIHKAKYFFTCKDFFEIKAAKRFTKNSIFLQGKLKKFVLKIKARREYLSVFFW